MSGSDDLTVRLWGVSVGTYKKPVESHIDCVNAVAFSPNGEALASASNDQTIRPWDGATGAYKQTFEAHCGYVLDVTFSPNSKLLA